MFFRAKRALRRAIFDYDTRLILRISPLRTNREDVTIVSMICHGEISMYLLAVASFCRRIGSVPAIVILDDGSLTPPDRAILATHLPDARLHRISEVRPGRCPKGGCWERLLLISDIVQSSYVVQLDSDTLTLGGIPEVSSCIAENRSFTLLGDGSFAQIEPMQDAWVRYRGNLDPKVQAICERSFDQLEECASLKYLRGNAGFTGFARGSITRDRIEWFSDRMRSIAGGRWDEWGSEQLVSNLLISNSDRALPLPFPKYLSHWARPEIRYNESAFVHFIGPHRFANGLYRHIARRVLTQLSAG